MKLLILTLLFLAPTHFTNAQIQAITETGKRVELFENGKWAYVESKNEKIKDIPFNSLEFSKNTAANFLVKSTNIDAGIWIDPEKWAFEPNGLSPAAEFSFVNKSADLYAMFITEKVVLPIEKIKPIVLLNLKRAMLDAQIVKEEYRTVNGNKVLSLQIAGTIQGMEVVYLGYYSSSSKGLAQLLTFCQKSLFFAEKEEMENFLNGYVVLN